MQEQPDSLIIRTVLAGDVEAFNILVNRYGSRVYSLCYHLCRNEADAKDLTQTIFLKAFKYLGKFKQESSFMTWLHAIALNSWMNIVKRRKILSFFSLDEMTDTGEEELPRQVADPAQNVEQQMIDRETESVVQKYLTALSPEYRVVIVLRLMEGRSYEEIGALCGCSIGTVGSRLSRAIEDLRGIIGSLKEDAHEV